MPGTLAGLPVSNRRKVGMTSSPHGLYAQGCKRATMAETKRRETVRWSKPQKVGPSSDRSLQLDSVKLESLVIVHQLGTVNMFLSLVHTARQVMEAGSTRSRPVSGVPKVSSVTGTKS